MKSLFKNVLVLVYLSEAFLNATTTQGLKKFGQIAEELDPNPYDRLSAAFDNLVKSGLNIELDISLNFNFINN